jgi:peptide/nickel transport system permease protein
MGRYLLRRVAQSMVTLVLATMVVFAGVRALPGDPARALAGEENDPARIAAVRAKYGLDDAVWLQYWHYLTNSLTGDFGTSVRTNIPVAEMLKSALPVTIELSLLSLSVAALIGVLTGVLAAVRRGHPAEWLSNAFALLGLSVPNFWLGLMAILYLSVALAIFPASGHVPFFEDPLANLHHMVLPSLVLGTGLAAVIMRQTRSSMLDALGTDYIRTARAKGLAERTVIGVHALRNSLIVVVTIVGLQLGALISGAVVTERIFGLPGFGKLTVDSVFQRDYPVIQGVVLVTASAYILINLLVDLLYSLIDPRIRVQGEAT